MAADLIFLIQTGIMELSVLESQQVKENVTCIVIHLKMLARLIFIHYSTIYLYLTYDLFNSSNYHVCMYKLVYHIFVGIHIFYEWSSLVIASKHTRTVFRNYSSYDTQIKKWIYFSFTQNTVCFQRFFSSFFCQLSVRNVIKRFPMVHFVVSQKYVSINRTTFYWWKKLFWAVTAPFEIDIINCCHLMD